jgi:hypothetical protein
VIRGISTPWNLFYRLHAADVSKKPAHMAMKIVNATNDVSTAVTNVNASDMNEMNTKMTTAKTNTLLENRECSKLLLMGRNLQQILYATEKDVENVSRNLLMLLVRSEHPLDDLLMQKCLRFLESKFFCGGSGMICAFGKHSVLHTFGLRAIWFTVLEHRTTNCGFGRRKKTKFCIIILPLVLPRKAALEMPEADSTSLCAKASHN